MSGTAFSSTQLLTQFLQDEAFLLRCANTFDWEHLTRRCTLIVEIFTTSILDRHEANHRQIKRSAVRQLTQTDHWRNTPLHLACFNRAQSSVIEALLEAAAAANVNLVEFQKAGDDTPLLIACGMGASPRVIELLVNTTVVHCGDIDDANKSINSISGRSSGGGSNASIRLPDSSGKTPLVELCHYYEKSRTSRQRQRGRYQNAASSPTMQEAHLLDLGLYSNLFQDFWESANHLLRSNWIHTRPGNESSFISILHAAAGMAESCPADFIDLLLRTYPHMISFRSRNGVLPLHLAITTTTASGDETERHELQQQQRCYVISRLCSLYPPSVSRVCPFSGRTPFCQAISSGLAWSGSKQPDVSAANTSFFVDGTSNNANDDDHNDVDSASSSGPLKILLQHQPDALYSRDLSSHLYPFLLAAASKQVDERQHTDTVFGLLRAYPQVLNALSFGTNTK